MSSVVTYIARSGGCGEREIPWNMAFYLNIDICPDFAY